MTAPIRSLLVVAAILAFLLGAFVAEGADIWLTAAAWVAIGGAAFAAAHLP